MDVPDKELAGAESEDVDSDANEQKSLISESIPSPTPRVPAAGDVETTKASPSECAVLDRAVDCILTEHEAEPREPRASCVSLYGNLIYDVVAISISLLDLGTDVYILWQFHEQQRTALFIASLVVLLMAQLSYCFAFTTIFSQYNDKFPVRACTFLSCLPFAPLLSFIFYFAADAKSPFSKRFLHGICGLRVSEPYVDANASKFKQWYVCAVLSRAPASKSKLEL